MKFLTFKKYVAYLFLLSLSSSAWGSTAIENQYLAQIKAQLEALGPLINAAQAQSNPNARVQFQYAKFRADLNTMEQGLHAQITQSDLQLRAVAPLQGDYSEVP